MIVIADTTPLHYLILIQHTDILRALYGTVIIPGAVHGELHAPSTPEKVKQWMDSPPIGWKYAK